MASAVARISSLVLTCVTSSTAVMPRRVGYIPPLSAATIPSRTATTRLAIYPCLVSWQWAV